MLNRCILCLTVLSIFTGITAAQVPEKINYQGVLTDLNGSKVPDGTYALLFRLYTTPEAEKAVWAESQSVSIKNGLFNVNLGDITPLSMDFDRPYWLGISVNGGDEMKPRIELTASAYSLNARSVSDSAITSEKIADGAVTLEKINPEGATTGQVITRTASGVEWQSASGGLSGSGTANYIARFSGATSLTNSNIQYGSEHNGNIGIGASPDGTSSKLVVSHNVMKGVTSPAYLARFQTQVAFGTPAIKASITRSGDAYFEGTLKVGQNSISIAEIRQLTGITSSSTYTYIYLPADWNGSNTRVLSLEVDVSSTEIRWRPVGGYIKDANLYYHVYSTYIQLYQNTEYFTNQDYRVLIMRIA